MKNLTCILTLFCALNLSALAQNKTATAPPKQAAEKTATPVKDAKTVALPATVEFTVDQSKDAVAKRDASRLAGLEAENLFLKIQKAQEEYEKLRDRARKAQAAYVDFVEATAEKQGIPQAALRDYELNEENGKFVLRKKAEQPESAPKKDGD